MDQTDRPLCPPCKRGECEDCMDVDYQPRRVYGCLCQQKGMNHPCPRPKQARPVDAGYDYGIPGV